MNILMAELPENSNLQSIELSVCMGCIQVFGFFCVFFNCGCWSGCRKGGSDRDEKSSGGLFVNCESWETKL